MNYSETTRNVMAKDLEDVDMVVDVTVDDAEGVDNEGMVQGAAVEDADAAKERIVRDIEHNICQRMQYVQSRTASMKVHNINETLCVNSGLEVDIFNKSYGGVITEEVANNVMQYYLQRKLPMAWWVGPSSTQHKDWDKNMQNAGFVRSVMDVGMHYDVDKHVLEPRTIPDELVIEECIEGKDFTDFGEVMASILGDRVKGFYGYIGSLPEKSRDDIRLFVGRVDGRPVASVSVFCTNIAGIYDVFTCPDMQRKGYGSAMLYTALKFAIERGFKDIVLQSTPEGLGLYKRFGFEGVCEFDIWSNKDKLQQQTEDTNA